MRAVMLGGLVAALAGCGDLGFAVAVTIDASALSADERRAIDALALAVSGAHTTSARHRPTAALVDDAEERFVYRPLADATGAVHVRIVAEQDGAEIAAGELDVGLVPAHTVDVTVPLTRPGAPGDDLGSDGGRTDGPVPDLAGIPVITPLAITLCPGQSTAFTLDRAVTLAVVEPDGGQLSEEATHAWRYTAPSTYGTYHVSATDAGGAKAEATISVACLETVVGDLDGAGSTDGVPGTARFNGPMGLLVAPGGDLIVADSGNHTLRRIDHTNGKVSTLVGLAGAEGWTEGTGDAARLSRPIALATDGIDTVFFTDGCRVRMVSLSDRTTTKIAGGANCAGDDGDASTARFDRPTGLAYVAFQDALYVADTNGYTLRRITLGGTVAVTTVAGKFHELGVVDGAGSVARFRGPWGVLYSGSGILVTDEGSRSVRRFDLVSELLTTVAGQWSTATQLDGIGTAARFIGPTGITADEHGLVLMTDRAGNLVRTFDPGSAAVGTVVGDTLEHVVLGPLPGGVAAPYAIAALGRGRVAITSGHAILQARW